MNQIKNSRCIVCEREFKQATERRGSRKRNGGIVKHKGIVNCSKKCSKVYARILNQINRKILYEKMKSIKKMELNFKAR